MGSRPAKTSLKTATVAATIASLVPVGRGEVAVRPGEMVGAFVDNDNAVPRSRYRCHARPEPESSRYLAPAWNRTGTSVPRGCGPTRMAEKTVRTPPRRRSICSSRPAKARQHQRRIVAEGVTDERYAALVNEAGVDGSFSSRGPQLLSSSRPACQFAGFIGCPTLVLFGSGARCRTVRAVVLMIGCRHQHPDLDERAHQEGDSALHPRDHARTGRGGEVPRCRRQPDRDVRPAICSILSGSVVDPRATSTVAAGR